MRASEFQHIGSRESGIQVTRHRECRIHDRGNLDRKISVLTGSRVLGIRETYARPLDSQSCEFRSLECKEEIPWIFLWVQNS
jgi:hypothetical protein